MRRGLFLAWCFLPFNHSRSFARRSRRASTCSAGALVMFSRSTHRLARLTMFDALPLDVVRGRGDENAVPAGIRPVPDRQCHLDERVGGVGDYESRWRDRGRSATTGHVRLGVAQFVARFGASGLGRRPPWCPRPSSTAVVSSVVSVRRDAGASREVIAGDGHHDPPAMSRIVGRVLPGTGQRCA
jgi:hypothetical protein